MRSGSVIRSRGHDDHLCSKKELQARSGLGWRQAKHLMAQLGVVGIGGRRYVYAADLEAFLTARRRSTENRMLPDTAGRSDGPRAL